MGLKKNVLYSTALTLSTYLVPLLVYPHISRVLNANGIGAIDAVDSIINYAIMVSMMGLTTIGIREIAKNKDNSEDLKRTFSSLFTLNLFSTLFVLLILIALLLFVPGLTDRRDLFFVGLSKIVFNLFWIEWFFKGMENFRYITIRSIILRLFFIVAVYVFVRDKSDTITYYILWVGLTAGNAICNWSYRRKIVRYDIHEVSLMKYVRPFILLGLFAIFSAISTQLNVSYLKYSCGDEQVGFYTTATKLYMVVIAIFSSMTSVIIPRMSALVKEKNYTEIKNLTSKTFQLLFLLAFPAIIFFELFATDFILVFAGSGFEGAVLPMRVVICQLLIIGTEQIFILQLLIPAQKDKETVRCAMLGALTCILVNIFITHQLQSLGSALAWFASESVVLAFSSYYVYKNFKISFPFGLFFKNMVAAIPYFIFGFIILYLFDATLVRLVSSILLFIIWAFFVEEYIFKINMLRSLSSILKRNNR